MPDPRSKSPQIGVRFPKPDMERLRKHAEVNYAGNMSVMVQVAVKRLIDAEQSSTVRDVAKHELAECKEQAA